MASACISELHLELKTARRAVRLELDKTPVESYKIGVYERQVENLLEELKLHTLTAEAIPWTGGPQQLLPSPTLQEAVEHVSIELKRHGIDKSWPPESAPNMYPYSNNRVDDFIDLANHMASHVKQFTQTPEYKRKVEFHLITGGSGSGKTRMGMEIRRMLAQKAATCQDNSLWATAQAMHIDFNGTGDPLTAADDHISADCILGLRVAARNVFHCDLSELQRHLPVQHERLFTLKQVMLYLASQKRKSLGLGADAMVLQCLTVDELQLVSGQSEELQNNARNLTNVLIGKLASWMTSGGGKGCVCLTVLIGTGLEYAQIGMSGYEKVYRHVCHLSQSQVSDLMADSVAKVNRLTVVKANSILSHRVMKVQLNLLMGLPGFMDMALDVLHTKLRSGSPQTEKEVRQLAGQLSIGVRNKIKNRLKDDFRALGAEVVFRLLLLSLSGVTVNESTCISNGMTLEDASTRSGIVWTFRLEDGVQAILQPVVQYQAVTYCLSQMHLPGLTRFLEAMQECMPFPYNNIIDGPPFERLVAISIASAAHLFSAGVTNVPGKRTWSHFFPTAAMSRSLGSCEFTVNALHLARDHHQLFRSTRGGGSFDLTVDAETCLEIAGTPNEHLTWDDPNFLVFMDSLSGPRAPSGDLRFVVKTLTGRLQVVVVQCKKVGTSTEEGHGCTVSLREVQHHLTQLRACFYRWNARNSMPVDLVYVWATTARASTKLLEYASQQQDLIIVHCEALKRVCPLLAIAPELYSARPEAQLDPGLQHAKASRCSIQTHCALPKAHVRAHWHRVPSIQVRKRCIQHQVSRLAYSAGCTLGCFVLW